MNLGNRYSQHSFAQIPNVNLSRSKFDRSSGVKTTCDFDDLVPIFIDEIVPGDTMNLNVKSFIRLATQVNPVMDNMYVDFFFFFVPCRLVWSNWEKFNGAQTDPGDSTDYTVPTITVNNGTGFASQSIYDQFGIPTLVDDITINALPLRAYQLIYDSWFRDQNLDDSLSPPTDDGPDAYTLYSIVKRRKKHDYFTSCLPWPQKGDAVTMPLGDTAPIVSTGDEPTMSNSAFTNREIQVASGTNNMLAAGGAVGGPDNIWWGSETGLEADLANAVGPSINLFRQAIMMQSLLELDARGGTRYVEILKAHFGVISPDFRLQRPELLSIGQTNINQHPVPQTSSTSGSNYQAGLAAFSTASTMGGKVGFSKSFVEHGYVIGLMSARADITYQQGLNKLWSRSTRYDFFWPKLQELGEQAVLNKEIYAQGDANDDLVFGYQERYAEYRYKPSEIRGQFRSNYATPLDSWHLAEEFSSLPALNATFIASSTPVERSLAVTAGYPHLLVDLFFDLKHARPIMTYGVPATLGRF